MRKSTAWAIGLGILSGIVLQAGLARAATDPATYPFPFPTNCTQWRADAGGEGPTVNGQNGTWLCTDEPDGTFRIEWPGIH